MPAMRETLGTASTSARVRTFLLAWPVSIGIGIAQDIEPRRWTHMPVGTDIVGAGYIYTVGDLRFDPASRIQDAKVEQHSVLLSYNHYLDLFGQTARLDVLVPYQLGSWEGLLDGAPAATSRDGFGDPRLRFSVNLAGAPALQGREYLDHVNQRVSHTTVGAAVAVRLPLGEYYADRLINLGQNRYSIEPQLGVLHTAGAWSYELTGSAFFYTDNDEFFGNTQLEQDPLYYAQAHVVRSFESGLWVSMGAAYGWGGESSIDDNQLDDARSNLQYGVSCGLPIGAGQSLRVAYIRGDTFADVGTDSHSLLLTWALRL